MKSAIALAAALLLIGAGCTSFSTHAFRVEQTATHLAFTAYAGYTNALPALGLTPQQSNDVKQARLKFAATVKTVEGLRLEYATNAAVKPQLQAILPTLVDQSSNVVWLINYVRGGK